MKGGQGMRVMRILRILPGWLVVGLVLSGCAGVTATPEPPARPAVSREPQPLPPPAPPPRPATPPGPVVDADLLRMTLAAEQEQLAWRLKAREDEFRVWRGLDEQLRGLAAAERRPVGWADCLARLGSVVDGYRRTGELLAVPERLETWTGEMVRRLGEDYRRDLAFADGDCRETLRLAELAAAADLAVYRNSLAEQMEAAVLRYLESGREEDAIRALGNLEVAYPGWEISPAPLSRIAAALFRQGKTAEALQLLTRHGGPARKEGRERLLRARADLLLLAGRVGEARRLYEELAVGQAARREEEKWVAEQLALLKGEAGSSETERRLFLGVLRDALLFDGRRLPPALRAGVARLERDFPASQLTERARRLEAGVGREAAAWLERQQVKVDESLAAKDFSAAVSRLEKLLEVPLPPESRRQTREALEAVLAAKEREEQERRLREEQALNVQWEEAVRLQGLRKYDEALSAFGRLFETAYGDQARQRSRETALAAATDLRREAAGLFLRAQRAADPQQKREQAAASWRLLRRILEHYPDTDLTPRIKDNLRSLEEYLAGQAPDLLEKLREAAEKTP